MNQEDNTPGNAGIHHKDNHEETLGDNASHEQEEDNRDDANDQDEKANISKATKNGLERIEDKGPEDDDSSGSSVSEYSKKPKSRQPASISTGKPKKQAGPKSDAGVRGMNVVEKTKRRTEQWTMASPVSNLTVSSLLILPIA